VEDKGPTSPVGLIAGLPVGKAKDEEVESVTAKEKVLYHQIHPLKLLADWGAGLLALYPFWRHAPLTAVLVALIPPGVASFLLLRFADLERYKDSAFGRYVGRYMTRQVEAVRFAGYVVAALGAWYHLPWLIPAGLAVTVLAWHRGVLFPA
jgi:hypothetical protein